MVTFTFDDGYKNVYDNALPIFKKYGMVGVTFPIVQDIQEGESYCVTWPQLLEFQTAGWEIGSHTITHPRLTTLTPGQIDYELKRSKQILASQGITAKTLAFPYGAYNAQVLDYATRYYENSRKASGGEPNAIGCDRYKIKVREVSHLTPAEEVIAWIEEAVQQKKWLVLLLHEVVTGAVGEEQYNAADLEKIVKYVADNAIPVMTIQQALAWRQATLGPNLIKNPGLENKNIYDWANNWSRNDPDRVLVEGGAVKRLFSAKNRLKIIGDDTSENVANPAIIKLPSNQKSYFISFFAQLTSTNENGGAEVYVDEFDNLGYWVGGRWLGGVYATTFGLPGFLYQPSSPLAKKVRVNIYTIPGANVTFWGDNFYFGLAN
jgi:peptidoglycan/xylan/chitin deacetylase (PgdA/CDA1 family)